MSVASAHSNETALPPIPWTFTPAEGGVWMWDTRVFRALISAVPGGHSWEVLHHGSGQDQSVASGTDVAFAAAETSVREIIGKAYHPRLGFRRFAGTLATSFQLEDGSWIDFGPLEFSSVTLGVRRPDGEIDQITGVLRVTNFSLLVDTMDDNLVSLLPHHVVSVRAYGGSTPPAQASPGPKSRITSGKPGGGCTGRAGFTAGTVDHIGAPPCPLHE